MNAGKMKAAITVKDVKELADKLAQLFFEVMNGK